VIWFKDGFFEWSYTKHPFVPQPCSKKNKNKKCFEVDAFIFKDVVRAEYRNLIPMIKCLIID